MRLIVSYFSITLILSSCALAAPVSSRSPSISGAQDWRLTGTGLVAEVDAIRLLAEDPTLSVQKTGPSIHSQTFYESEYLYSRSKGHKASKPSPPKHNSPAPPGSPPKKPHMSVGQKIKNWFHHVGQKIKTGFQKFGQKVKQGFQKFAQKAKAGFKKVGHWFKTTGAKIAKFGLKVISTVGSVVGKAVGFVFKPVGQAIELASKGISVAADKIHAKLSPKLEKGMKIMDAIQDPIGYAAKKLAQKATSHSQPHAASHPTNIRPHH